jgi:nucleotide-binding universal stress UspA family protein
MSKTIICATDFSPAADEAAELALRLARSFGDRLELVHWIRRSPFILPEMVLATLGPMQEQARKAILARRDRLSGKGVEVTANVEIGDVDDVLVDRGAKADTRLLVLGSTHGRAGATRAFIGSIARRVARTAACPVLAVPATSILSRGGWAPERPLKVTVAVDLSPASDAALDWVKSLTEVTACLVELVHAYWPLRENVRLGLPWPPEEFDADLEVKEVLDRELRARIDRIWGRSAAPLHLRPGLGVGPSVIATEAQAEGADLLVVGTSQHRIGSMGLGTMVTANLPVLCVPARLGATSAEPARIAPVRTLMVPTDLSSLGNAAVTYACRMLATTGGTIFLCHAVSDPRGLTIAERDELHRRLLALLPAESSRLGIRARVFIQESRPPAEAIVQAARRLGCDGIVMSSHGRSGLSGALLASVAEAVVRQAPVPVTVVSARASEPGS